MNTREYIARISEIVPQISAETLDRIADLMMEVFEGQNTLFTMGNGGHGATAEDGTMTVYAESRILLADGEPDCRQTLSAVLQREGHRVTTADDGREASKVLAQDEVDLLIADTIDGKSRLNSSGAYNSRMPPHGYTLPQGNHRSLP